MYMQELRCVFPALASSLAIFFSPPNPFYYQINASSRSTVLSTASLKLHTPLIGDSPA
jgi:hypothetical protein